MVGRNNKKSPDNFEKIKREMTTKRQKATSQENNGITSRNEINVTLSLNNEIKEKNQIQVKINMQLEDNKNAVKSNAKIVEAIKESNMEEMTKESITESNKDSLIQEKKIEIITFWVGEEEFALLISSVKEIIKVPSITQIPNAPFYIAGLCALRGQLLPVIDSRKLFGMADKERSENCRIVITETNGKSVGIITDRVSEVTSIEKSAIKEPPSTLNGNDVCNGIINGILLLHNGQRVIMILDAHKIFNVGTFRDDFDKQDSQKSNDNDTNKLSKEEQIVVFNVGSQEYAIGINNVKEIIRYPETTKVPSTADYIEGVSSLRKQLIVVINLGKLLGIDSNRPDEYRRVIIISAGELTFGVVVDKVSQVMGVQKDSFKMGNLTVNNSRKDYIKGFYNLDNGNKLVAMLEVYKLISSDDANKIIHTDSQKNVEDITQNSSEIHKSMEQIVVFKLGEEEYGIRVNNVKEINRISEIVPFPGSPAFIDGMVNLRDYIIPVLNLRTLFGLQTTYDHDSLKFMVVEFRKKTIGIKIDSASEVLEIPITSIEKATKSLEDTDVNSYMDSIVKLDKGKKIVLLLNLESVLSFI